MFTCPTNVETVAPDLKKTSLARLRYNHFLDLRPNFPRRWIVFSNLTKNVNQNRTAHYLYVNRNPYGVLQVTEDGSATVKELLILQKRLLIWKKGDSSEENEKRPTRGHRRENTNTTERESWWQKHGQANEPLGSGIDVDTAEKGSFTV